VPKPSCGFSSDREKIDLLLVVGEPRDYHAGETGSRKGSWKRRRLNTFQLFDHTGSPHRCNRDVSPSDMTAYELALGLLPVLPTIRPELSDELE
jgi:hypothetical protein